MKKDYLKRILEGGNVESVIKDEIKERSDTGKTLALKFPELKGLSFSKFLGKLPIELDFITANEMYQALNALPLEKGEKI